MFWLKYVSFSIILHQVCSYNLVTYKIPITGEIKKELGYPEGCYLNFTELATKNGYNSQEHEVITEDGYILTVFRIQSPNCTSLQRLPILVLHGVLLNSDLFLTAGVNTGWPYLLADACHDVWFGNQRGNNYGRKHTSLDPDKDPEFWDFALDEYGYYDIPNMMDYVLNSTGKEQLNLMGYSLGGLSTLVALSSRPEYNEKIAVNIFLAASSTFAHMKSVPLKFLALFFYTFEKPLRTIGVQEVLFTRSVLQVLLEYICQHASLYDECLFLISILDSKHSDSYSVNTVQTMLSNFLCGTSVKFISQAGRNVVKNDLYKYDYGKEQNILLYGTETPPMYNLSAVTAPTVIIHGINDAIAVVQDVESLAEALPNVLELYTVSDKLWNHVDCGYNKNIPTVLYPKVEEYLNMTNT